MVKNVPMKACFLFCSTVVFIGMPGHVPSCGATSIIINEFMANPIAVADSVGEWLELYNPTAVDINLAGWTIRDDGSDIHVIDNGSPLWISASRYLVLGKNNDFNTNGGLNVDYEYSGFILANSGDEIELLDAVGLLVDRVAYTASYVQNGRSSELINPAYDNALPASWATSTSRMPNFDYGTPGAINSQYTHTPEPATLLLFGTGLAGLAGTGMKRKKRA